MAAEADATALSREPAGDRRVALGFALLLTLAWASHRFTLFNGLATPLFILAGLWCVWMLREDVRVERGVFQLAVAFALWVLVVDAWAEDILPALARDGHWFLLAVLAIASRNRLVADPGVLRGVQTAAILCILVTAAFAFVWVVPPLPIRGVPVFNHARHLGLSVGFMVAILCLPAPDSGVWRPALVRIARIVGVALVVWSGTRSSMLGLLVALALVAVLVRHGRMSLLIDTAIGTALSTMVAPLDSASSVLDALARTTSSVTADQLSSMRLSMWTSTLRSLADNGAIWTGLGGNGFMSLQVHHGANIVPPYHVQAHNFFVQALADWGIIGLLLFLALLLRTGRTVADVAPSPQRAIGAAGIAYILITGQLDATLYHLEHLVFLAVSVGIAASAMRFRENPDPVVIRIRDLRIVFVGLAVVHLLAADHRSAIGWYFPTNCRPSFMHTPCHSLGLIIR